MTAPMQWAIFVVQDGERRRLRLEIRTDEHGVARVAIVCPGDGTLFLPEPAVGQLRADLGQAQEIARNINARGGMGWPR